MMPQTAVAVMLFLLLIVPGISFELLRQTRRPSFDQTALEELARVLLASVGFTGAAALVLVPLSMALPKAVVDVSTIASQGAGWYWSHYPERVLWTIGLAVCIATGLALLVHRSLNHPDERGWAARAVGTMKRILRHQPGEQVERFPLWRTLFRDARPLGAVTKLTVLKKDGTMVTGNMAGYTTDGSRDERDLALAQPIEIFRLGDREPRRVPEGWRVVILAASDISEIFVTWPPKGRD